MSDVEDALGEVFQTALKEQGVETLEEEHVEATPEVAEEAAEPAEADDTSDGSGADPQEAASAPDPLSLSDEDLEGLDAEGLREYRKNVQADYTRKTQELARQRRAYEALEEAGKSHGVTHEDLSNFLPILVGLKTDPAGVVERLSKSLGAKRPEPSEAQQPDPFETELQQALGPDLGKQVAPILKKAIDAGVEQRVQAQVGPLQQRQQETQFKTMVAEWKAANPDVDTETEAEMDRLWNQIQTQGYPAAWDVLKQAVLASRNGRDLERKKQARVSKPAPKLDKGKPPSKEGGDLDLSGLDIEDSVERIIASMVPDL